MAAGTVTLSFAPTSGDCQWIVPAGVTSVTMIANGAQGGTGYHGAAGKLGDQATATFDVAGGDSFIFQVGAKGQDGSFAAAGAGGALTGAPGGVVLANASFGGGGGCGASFVWKGSDIDLDNDTIYLAGGGGGGSAAISDPYGGGGGGGGGAYSAATTDHTAVGAAAVENSDGPSGASFWKTDAPNVSDGVTSSAAQSGDGLVTVSFAQVATTTTLTATPPAVFGAPISLTATISPAPSEGVAYFYVNDGGHLSGISSCFRVPVDTTTGVATCTVVLPRLHVSNTEQVQAFYVDDADVPIYGNSFSPPFTPTINPAPTTTTVTSSPNPSVYGEPFTITAFVKANAPSTIDPLQDWVHFQVDGQPVECQESSDSDVSLAAGGSSGSIATCTVYEYDTLEDLHAGNHTIEAIFVPGDDYVGSTGTVTQVINPASTTTIATAVYYNYASGPIVAITATVAINPPSILSFQPYIGLSDVFRGNVSFFNGTTLLCTVPLDEWAQALCESAINPSSTPPHNLTVIYNYDDADPDFVPSSATTDAVAHIAQPTLVSLTTVFPNSGASWLVQGGGFSGATSVTVCAVSVPFTVINDNTMLIGVPAVNAPRQCVVTVIAAGGTGSSNGNITVVPKPQPGAPVVVFPTGPSTPSTAACADTTALTLSGRWTLVAWPGEDGISIEEALSGGNDNCGSDVSAEIAVIWGFDAAMQTYQAYFPSATNIPGANDLDNLTRGLGYWVALNNPTASVTWPVETAG